MNRPVGFADIVEKVKPAVVAVRVKVDANAKTTGFEGNSPFPPNSPMEQFFRRFGMPAAWHLTVRTSRAIIP